MKRSLLLLAALAALSFAPTADATSCAVPEFATSLQRATLVFTGRATVAKEDGHQTLADLRVDRVYRGSVPARLRVVGGGMKGAVFESGKQYLVFARILDDGSVFAHLCGGTGPVRSDWVKQLGPGSAPSAAGAPVAALPDASSDADPEPTEVVPVPVHDDPSTAWTDGATPTEPRMAPEPAPSAPPAAPSKSGCGACAAAHGPTPRVELLLLAIIAVALTRRGARGQRCRHSH